MYRFETNPWGLCQIETATSGKYGFGLPKLFRITSFDGAFKGAHTLRFTDRMAMGFGALEQKNADLIRLAISQFCAWKWRSRRGLAGGARFDGATPMAPRLLMAAPKLPGAMAPMSVMPVEVQIAAAFA